MPGCHGKSRRKLCAGKRGSWGRHGLNPRRTVDVTAKEVLTLDDLVPHGVDGSSVHPHAHGGVCREPEACPIHLSKTLKQAHGEIGTREHTVKDQVEAIPPGIAEIWRA